jgi:tetratricopeptide (TPR) repeat protein
MAITAALLIFYSNSFTADWHYDDFHHIKENINIRKFSNIPQFFVDPSTFSRNPQTNMYRPLLMTTHAINYQLGLLSSRDGYNVVWYHITNFLFHLIASIAVFFIVKYLFTRTVKVESVNPILTASFAGLLFGLHTINTETIVYLSSRSSVMSSMFTFLALFLYLKATDKATTRYGLIIFSGVIYLCGLMSKEIAITLPAMLIYYEFLINKDWMKDRPKTNILITLFYRMVPYGLAASGYLFARHLTRGENLIKILAKKGGTQAAKNMTSQLATQSRVWIHYIKEWLWPTSLSIDKPFKVSRNFVEFKVIVSLIIIALIIFLALRVRKKHPLVTFGILWFFTALLPTSLFRLNIVANDHRLYLPGLGATLVFCYIAALLARHYFQLGGKRLKIFATICIATLLFMGLGTYKRNMAFATEETMWKDVILKDKRSVRGYNNLGIWYEQQGEFDKAIRHYSRTVQLAPMFPNPYINLGNVYHKKKDFAKAEKFMKRALSLDPKSALASYNLGNILRESGKTHDAVGSYKRALQLNPRYIEAANNLANIYFKGRNFSEAIKYYRQALFIDPTFAMSYYNIGLAQSNMGKHQEAIQSFEKFIFYWRGDRKFLAIAQGRINQLQQMPINRNPRK